MWSIAGVAALLLLTAFGTANPDPRPNEARAAPVSVRAPVEPAVADPSLSAVSGTVISTRGAPYAGATVTLRESGPSCGRCGRSTVGITAEDGAFSLAVPDGVYSLACSTREATVCWLSRAASVRQAALRVDGPITGLRFVAPLAAHPRPR
jgi:hypothetical protein